MIINEWIIIPYFNEKHTILYQGEIQGDESQYGYFIFI
jgi:hypothetical protein